MTYPSVIKVKVNPKYIIVGCDLLVKVKSTSRFRLDWGFDNVSSKDIYAFLDIAENEVNSLSNPQAGSTKTDG